MKDEIIHLYFMPGMAASPKIFEHIKLPEDKFRVHYLEWILPLKNETLQDYAFRMSKHIKHENPVLLGVSFGGILVQEISKFITAKKIIVVSSVKHHSELPRRMQIAKKTKVYKLIPTQLASKIDVFSRYIFGDNIINKRLDLYKMYLSVNDSKYLSWAIEQIINWKQTQETLKVIHIHGEKDEVFPIKNISNCIVVKGGTHIMILNKYKWFNENLPRLILD